MEIEILVSSFILFHCALVHCSSPGWFSNLGEYHTNTQVLSSIIEDNYYVKDEVINLIENTQFFKPKCFSICINNTFESINNACYCLVQVNYN